MLKNIINKRTLTDLIIYLGIPLLIWNTGRSALGDYWAMLLSTVPGVIYTVYTFIKEKQFSVTGLFILATMIIGSIMDIYSKTAQQMLWNYVYLNFGFAIFWCLTMLARKPMAMYFFIDYAFLHGVPKDHSRALYHSQPFFKYFMLLTLFLAGRDFFDACLRIFLINFLDAEGANNIGAAFNKIKIITQIWSLAMTVIFVYGILWIVKKIEQHSKETAKEK